MVNLENMASFNVLQRSLMDSVHREYFCIVHRTNRIQSVFVSVKRQVLP